MATPENVQAAFMQLLPEYHPYHVTLQLFESDNTVKFVQNQRGTLAPIFFCPLKGLLSEEQVKHWKSYKAFSSASLLDFCEMIISFEATEIHDEDMLDFESFASNVHHQINQCDSAKKTLYKLFECLNFQCLTACPITGEERWRLASEMTERKMQWGSEIVVRYI